MQEHSVLTANSGYFADQSVWFAVRETKWMFTVINADHLRAQEQSVPWVTNLRKERNQVKPGFVTFVMPQQVC